MQDDLLHMDQEEFAELINQVNINTVKDRDENQSTEDDSEDEDVIYKGDFDSEDTLIETEISALDLMDTAEKFDNLYPTPDRSIPSSPASLFTATIGERDSQDNEDSEEAEILTTWKAAFNAGRLVQPVRKSAEKLVNKARLERLLHQPGGLSKIHRRDLPTEPKWHKDLANHLLGALFELKKITFRDMKI
jgi:hypothetical protein